MSDDDRKDAETSPPPQSSGTLVQDRHIGRVLGGKYRILERIGQGGMGAVYRAEHSLVDRIVAIKILHSHLVENETFLKRFHQEAKVSSRISHPNAVTLWDFGIEENIPYLVLEYVKGRTLREIISSQGAISPNKSFEILSQVCAALGAAHALNIVHRDLKPDNIMITVDADGSERARVLDFGIAKVLQHESGENAAIATQIGTLMGTPEYISPEQAMEKELDPRADLYSLGVILYEMLSGRVPFKSTSPLEVYVHHIRNVAPPIPEIAPELNLPLSVSRVVLKCLEKDPANRYQSAQELAKDFEAALAPERPRVPPPVSPPPPVRHPVGQKEKRKLEPIVPEARSSGVSSRRNVALGAGVVAFLAVGGLGLKALLDSESTGEPKPLNAAEQTESPLKPVALEATTTAPTVLTGPGDDKTARALAPTIETTTATVITGETTKQAPASEQEVKGPEAAIDESTKLLEAELLTSTSEPSREMPEGLPRPALPPLSILEPIPADPALQGLRPAAAKALAEKEVAQAEALLDKKEWEAAGLHFRRALALDEKHLRARLDFAICILRLRRPDAAITELEKALALDREYAPTFYSLASAHAVSGNIDAALENLGQAVKLFPGAKAWAREDVDFEALRENERFQALVRK